ncbi:MAG: hypothetical protein AB1567_08745 [bacterium]
MGLSRASIYSNINRFISNDNNESVRVAAIIILGRYIYEGVEAEIDSDWESYWQTIEIIDKESFLKVKNYLLKLINDKTSSIKIKRHAVEAISFLYEPKIIDIIYHTYNHPDERMKISALFSMGRNANTRFENIILKELDNPNYKIK